MNTGMKLSDLAAELERQAKTRLDFLAPMKKLEFLPPGDVEAVTLAGLPGEPKPLTEWAHGQVATFHKIPKPYYDRMRTDAPEMLAYSLNRWNADVPEAKRMVRTLDGNVRAWVSDSYRCLNSLDLALATLPVLKERGAVVESGSVTETKLYLKASLPTLEMPVKKSVRRGDVLRGGVLVRNSEVGDGAVNIDFFVTILACMNGMTTDSILRKAHLGKRLGGGLEEAVELFSDKTRRLDDAAFFSKVKDILNSTLSKTYLEAVVAKAEGAAVDIIPRSAKLDEVVEVVAARFSLPESYRTAVLSNLISGGDLTRWKLVNAITASANDLTDYEASSMLEGLGGKVLDLSSDEWTAVLPQAA